MSTPARRQGFGPGQTQDLSANVSHKVVPVVYSATPTFDASAGKYFQLTPTDGLAFEIQAPVNAKAGLEFLLRIFNSTGGPLGVLTFAAIFLLDPAGLTQPADGFNRSYRFYFDGTDWIEDGARTQDIPN
ncbi:MAG: hypothetical protein GY906_38615 [bacterium]|nr:hypothetical protein [bacterium]